MQYPTSKIEIFPQPIYEIINTAASQYKPTCMLHLSIPKPCHEDWAKMNPNEKGRHCNVCCKTVVDFTSMSDTEVKYFFINKKKEESVCCRFKNEQLHRIKIQLPYNIYTISMPLWKRFLTACLLAFSSMLFSCDALIGQTETMGVMALPEITTTTYNTTGEPVALIDTIAKPTCSTIIGDTISVETIAQGEVSIMPVENIILEEAMPAIEEPRNQEIILTGKVAYDTNRIIHPNAIDTAKPVKKPIECGSDFINL